MRNINTQTHKRPNINFVLILVSIAFVRTTRCFIYYYSTVFLSLLYIFCFMAFLRILHDGFYALYNRQTEVINTYKLIGILFSLNFMTNTHIINFYVDINHWQRKKVIVDNVGNNVFVLYFTYVPVCVLFPLF